MHPSQFHSGLKSYGIEFFCGVPDSLLAPVLAYITDNEAADSHIITANEGAAVAMAAGYYMATSKPALVYLQNSGLGNCVNPLTSITDAQVYNIPLLMMIGWRGEPNTKDEPQHVKQGQITIEQLELLGIDYAILPKDIDKANNVIEHATKLMSQTKRPFALVVQKGCFEPYKLQKKAEKKYEMQREDAIKIIIDALSEHDIVVSTTGKTSRELFEYRKEKNTGHARDFLTVGAMGHASHIALGIAIQKPARNVICIDGDGAALMHLGSLPVGAAIACKNFKHIIINNAAHDSVGGQQTVAKHVHFHKLAKALGYQQSFLAEDSTTLSKILPTFLNTNTCNLLEIKTNIGARSDLGRPTTTPIENKIKFMEFLEHG